MVVVDLCMLPHAFKILTWPQQPVALKTPSCTSHGVQYTPNRSTSSADVKGSHVIHGFVMQGRKHSPLLLTLSFCVKLLLPDALNKTPRISMLVVCFILKHTKEQSVTRVMAEEHDNKSILEALLF